MPVTIIPRSGVNAAGLPAASITDVEGVFDTVVASVGAETIRAEAAEAVLAAHTAPTLGAGVQTALAAVPNGPNGLIVANGSGLVPTVNLPAAFTGGVYSITALPHITTTGAADLVGVSQAGGDASVSWANVLTDLGVTIGQGTAASASAGTDKVWVNQGGASDVVQTLLSVGNYVLTLSPPTVQIIASGALQASYANRSLFVVTAGVTISAGTVTDGFRCELINASGGTITLDSSITPLSGSATLANNASVSIRATTAIGGGGTLKVLALSGGTSVLAPGIPTNLAAGGSGPTTISISWAAPASGGPLAGYIVQWQIGSGGTWSQVTGLTATSYTITGLTASTAYNIEVEATGAGGPSGFTAALSASTAATLTAPGATANLISTAQTSTTVALSWSPPSTGGTVADYSVGYRLTSAGGAYTIASAAVTTTTYTVTGLSNGTAYDFEVFGTNTAGTGAAATVGAIATTLAPPGQPTGLAAGAITGTTIALSWTAPTTGGAVASYTVTVNGVATTGVLTASTTLTGLTAGTAYTISVAAVNAGGTGTASSTISATTPNITVATPAAGASSATVTISGTYAGTFAGTQIDYGWSTTNTTAPTTWTTGIAASPSGGAWTASATYPATSETAYLWVRETTATSVGAVASGSTAITAPPPTYTFTAYGNPGQYGIGPNQTFHWGSNNYFATNPFGLSTLTASSGNVTTHGAGLAQIGTSAALPTGVAVGISFSPTVPPPLPTASTPAYAGNGNGTTIGTATGWMQQGVFNDGSFPGVWTNNGAYQWGNNSMVGQIYFWLITADMMAAGVPPVRCFTSADPIMLAA